LRVDTDLTNLTKEEENSRSGTVQTNFKEGENSPRYPDLYEDFDEAFIAFDWDLTIIHWNKAAERVTTIKARDALGKKVNEILPEMMSVDLTPYIDLLQQRKRARFMMNTISRETQKPSIFEISLYPSEQGVIVVVEDKTEEEKTKRLSAIGATASMVGHDIRNPLQAIVGEIYLLKEYFESIPQSEIKKEVAESLDSIEANVNYINKIVSDLQDYSRTINPEYSDFNLKDLIDAILKSVSQQNNLDILVNLDPSFTITSDRSMARRILTNLIVNSIQAMPNGGKISLQSFRDGGNILIVVEDNGVGIPDANKPKLFSPMFTTKAKGQGLGLAVVKRLVEALNGTITFESQEGKGTKFVIALPIDK
jgi:PAS domain S-box-containing protein